MTRACAVYAAGPLLMADVPPVLAAQPSKENDMGYQSIQVEGLMATSTAEELAVACAKLVGQTIGFGLIESVKVVEHPRDPDSVVHMISRNAFLPPPAPAPMGKEEPALMSKEDVIKDEVVKEDVKLDKVDTAPKAGKVKSKSDSEAS